MFGGQGPVVTETNALGLSDMQIPIKNDHWDQRIEDISNSFALFQKDRGISNPPTRGKSFYADRR
jgi:hypothetical protein